MRRAFSYHETPVSGLRAGIDGSLKVRHMEHEAHLRGRQADGARLVWLSLERRFGHCPDDVFDMNFDSAMRSLFLNAQIKVIAA